MSSVSNKKTIANYLIGVQVILVTISELFYYLNPMFVFLFYLPDIINIIFIAFFLSDCVLNNKLWIPKKQRIPFVILCAYFGYALISFAWGKHNVYEAVQRIRHIFSALTIYTIVAFYLNNSTYTFLINYLSKIQYLNFIIVFFQSIILRIHPDFANGIFGFDAYNNGISGMFCLALSLLAIVYYLDGKWSFSRAAIQVGLSCTICALAEIKLFFVIFIVCAVWLFVIRDHDKRSAIKMLAILGIISLSFLVAYRVLEYVLPDNLYTFFSIGGSLRYEQRANFAGRTNTIPFIYDHLYNQNLWSATFGSGLGSYSGDYIYELGKTFSDFGFIGVMLLFCSLISMLLTRFLRSVRNCLTNEVCFTSTFALAVLFSVVVWNVTFTRSTSLIFFFLAIGNVIYESRRSKE